MRTPAIQPASPDVTQSSGWVGEGVPPPDNIVPVQSHPGPKAITLVLDREQD